MAGKLAELDALQACCGANQCQDEDCVIENCGPTYVECVGGGADGLGCVAQANCIFDCQDDELCELACATPLSEVAAGD